MSHAFGFQLASIVLIVIMADFMQVYKSSATAALDQQRLLPDVNYKGSILQVNAGKGLLSCGKCSSCILSDYVVLAEQCSLLRIVLY